MKMESVIPSISRAVSNTSLGVCSAAKNSSVQPFSIKQTESVQSTRTGSEENLLLLLQSYYGLYHNVTVSPIEQSVGAAATTIDPHSTGTAHPVVVDKPETNPVVPEPVAADPHSTGTAHPVVVDKPEPNSMFNS